MRTRRHHKIKFAELVQRGADFHHKRKKHMSRESVVDHIPRRDLDEREGQKPAAHVAPALQDHGSRADEQRPDALGCELVTKSDAHELDLVARGTRRGEVQRLEPPELFCGPRFVGSYRFLLSPKTGAAVERGQEGHNPPVRTSQPTNVHVPEDGQSESDCYTSGQDDLEAPVAFGQFSQLGFAWRSRRQVRLFERGAAAARGRLEHAALVRIFLKLF
mmetsp:Transcript_1142/g.3062  ORF Transcript_1142/g.3062 Transcript_1142/m.3062 type:complete len:218 (+) Transcript_1142:406-1059(+)